MKLIISFVAVLILASLSTAQNLEVVCEGLKSPTDIVFDAADDSRMFVLEQKRGTIRVIENGELRDEPFLTIPKDRLAGSDWEQGILGLAFDPKFAENGRFYVNYTAPRKGGKRDPGKTRISRFVTEDKVTADPASETVLLEIDQPWGNHNGGCIRFGPEGMLYIGMGDGGAANDRGQNGQNLTTLLGAILRIDVTGEPDEGLAYAVPADNPFVGRADARDEIWVYGVRNPWGMEFDSKGQLWFGDVGQNRFEEISVVAADGGGSNYGWSTMEGFRKFVPRGRGAQKKDPPKLDASAHTSAGLTPPVWEYRHWNGKNDNARNGSVTGGFLYEGETVSSLRNRYIFADFMFGKVWSLRLKNGVADDVAEHTSAFASAFPGNSMGFAISRFGRDSTGELYVADHRNGRILKIVP